MSEFKKKDEEDDDRTNVMNHHYCAKGPHVVSLFSTTLLQNISYYMCITMFASLFIKLQVYFYYNTKLYKIIIKAVVQ